ncbi:hypothetical protein [Brucella intermedia]|uniref:hypothetical protein n=1 Tax=Brucella intermedia TaxID=94625 RepID=UPI0012D32CC0|nr:hypothetical protein [Brucella intermedia]
MRDQYAGEVSDVLKFALLRALARQDRTLGVVWYYAPGDDGRHLEWRDNVVTLRTNVSVPRAPGLCAASMLVHNR